MADEEGIGVTDHRVWESEHDFTGYVVLTGEESSKAVGEDEFDGGGAAAGDGN